MDLTCFKAYDIRGRLGSELNESIARRIGQAFAEALDAECVVLGWDCRETSVSLADAIAEGLTAAGVEVIDIGLSGTEEMYFATSHFGASGGICVTASHNPIDYNGMKMVKAGSAPLDANRELAEIRRLAEAGQFRKAHPGKRVARHEEARAAYVNQVVGIVDIAALTPMKILVNAGNGAAGPTFEAIAQTLAARGAPLSFARMHMDPDGSFPNGIPNPLLEKNQPATAQAVITSGADMGVAWDGDFDRCFFFDEIGEFVPGEYVVGLLAEAFLAKDASATIVHDPRVVLNTLDIVKAAGGKSVMARTGHAFVKQVMRDTSAVYGGEMSAHHYFRDFMACDSGMIPWLLVAELVGRRGQSLAKLLAHRRRNFPSSGEINFRVSDTKLCIARVRAAFSGEALEQDETDGLSLLFADWRFNLRGSNTEPLLRLNVESRGRSDLVTEGVEQISAIIHGA